MKVMKFINDLRTVATVGFSLLIVLVAAADTIYMRKSEKPEIVVQLETSRLISAIREKETELIYEKEPIKIQLLEALLIIHQSDLAKIQGAP